VLTINITNPLCSVAVAADHQVHYLPSARSFTPHLAPSFSRQRQGLICFMGRAAGRKTKKGATPAKKGIAAGAARKKVLTVSVTIFRGNHDLDVDELLPRLKHCVEGRCDDISSS